MNPAINELAISVMQKSLDECSITDIKQLAQQYPWFASAQVLYAAKLKSGNPAIFDEQVNKTATFFSNRLWLDHLLNDDSEIGFEFENQPADVVSETPSNFLQVIQTEPLSVVSDTPQETENVEAEIEIAHEPARDEPSIDQPAQLLTSEVTADIDHSDEPDVEEIDASKDDPEPAFRPMPQFKIEPVDPAKSQLLFEPFHTVDYFASQGIRFRDEEKPTDRFGQQLKSFTEWLKVLKKTPANDVASLAQDAGTEKKVEQMAEHSLAERHVVTEAMAEVWIKQGNVTRAVEIYRKLSLLDPSKSAYFAAKIDDLKKTS